MAFALIAGMPRPQRIQQEEFPYHIATKTAGRVFVFKKWTYKIIIQVLVEAEAKYGVLIHHFKMMHTHYHLIISTPLRNISEFEWYINNQIAKRLNKRMRRKGHLWGERFKSTIIGGEEYLTNCICYAYGNGVRAGLCKRACEDDQLSTFDFYARGKKVGFVVTEDGVVALLGNTRKTSRYNFVLMVDQAYTPDEINEIHAGLRRPFFGSADFMERMKQKYFGP